MEFEKLLEKVTREDMEQFYEKTKPVMTFKRAYTPGSLDFRFYLPFPKSPFWNLYSFEGEFRLAHNLETLKDIETLHPFAAPVVFRPIIADIMVQIPEGLMGAVAGFEVNIGKDGVQSCERNGHSYHKVITRLYYRDEGR